MCLARRKAVHPLQQREVSNSDHGTKEQGQNKEPKEKEPVGFKNNLHVKAGGEKVAQNDSSSNH